MSIIIAIDPGNVESAWVKYNGCILDKGKINNEKMLERIRGIREEQRQQKEDIIFCVEMIASYGMPVGRTVFETCLWIGRFIEAHGGIYKLVYRKDVKMHLCGNTRAKDANIRQALMDRYGSTREKAIGTVKKPGPLHGMSGDMWAALAVAVTFDETY